MKKFYSSILLISVIISSICFTGCETASEDKKSSNADLSALTLSTGSLNPAFSASTISYTAQVLNTVSSITVTPTKADSAATIKVNTVTVASGSASGAIDLTVGSNTISVVVTAESGSTKTYTITVTRLNSGEAVALTPADLAGNWGDAEYVYNSEDDEWDKSVINVNGSTLTHTVEMASGADTSSLTHFATFTLVYSITTGSTVTTPAGATELNMTQVSMTITLTDAATVSWANSNSLYGYTNWVINVAKSIAGLTEDGETEDANGTVFYTVANIASDILYIGDDEADSNYDGSTALKRPQVLDSGWASLDAK